MFPSLSLRRWRAAVAVLALAGGTGLAQASLSFSWSLDDWSPVVRSDEAVILHAHLYNDAVSTETLLGSRLLGRYGEGIEDTYDFADALPPLAQQLANVSLAPGEGMAFVFGRLLPQGGSVAPGDYQGGGFALAFSDDAGREVSWSPDRSLRVQVVAAVPDGQLPEPALPALLASAAAAAWWSRRVSGRRRPSRPAAAAR